MAITEDMDSPRLRPSDDRMPSGSRLFRRAGELTDEQFDLLAAAWSEDVLTGDALSEFESVIAVNADRLERAGSFRQVRLTPRSETWPGMNSCIKPSPVITILRHTVIPALLAVAAMIVLIINGPAGAKLKSVHSGGTVAEPAMAVAEIPASSPVIAVKKTPAISAPAIPVKKSPEISAPVIAAKTASPITAGNIKVIQTGVPENGEAVTEAAEMVRVQPLALAYGQASASPVATAMNPGITLQIIREVRPVQPLGEEKNWMLRGISFLASALTGKEKEIDGYMIANGCITGINTILGWDMELQQVHNSKGDPVAVNFSSALLSFTKPLNKTTP